MKTDRITAKDIEKKWLIIDAQGQVLGRLASQVALLLKGKHKPSFVPHLDGGDYVIVVNADRVVLTGNKILKKMYYRHSGYMGGLKSVSAGDLLKKKPTALLEYAVRGMLGRNKLRAQMMKNLKVYAGAEHPHGAQNPLPAPMERVLKATAGVSDSDDVMAR